MLDYLDLDAPTLIPEAKSSVICADDEDDSNNVEDIFEADEGQAS
jgi:hypothetical protein